MRSLQDDDLQKAIRKHVQRQKNTNLKNTRIDHKMGFLVYSWPKCKCSESNFGPMTSFSLSMYTHADSSHESCDMTHQNIFMTVINLLKTLRAVRREDNWS